MAASSIPAAAGESPVRASHPSAGPGRQSLPCRMNVAIIPRARQDMYNADSVRMIAVAVAVACDAQIE